MPVPRVGFLARNTRFCGAKRRISENGRTFMVLDNCIQCIFGALMIGRTITG